MSKEQEVMMQMTPKFGPAQQLVLRARFWPMPLLAGTLHFLPPHDGLTAAGFLSAGGRCHTFDRRADGYT